MLFTIEAFNVLNNDIVQTQILPEQNSDHQYKRHVWRRVLIIILQSPNHPTTQPLNHSFRTSKTTMPSSHSKQPFGERSSSGRTIGGHRGDGTITSSQLPGSTSSKHPKTSASRVEDRLTERPDKSTLRVPTSSRHETRQSHASTSSKQPSSSGSGGPSLKPSIVSQASSNITEWWNDTKDEFKTEYSARRPTSQHTRSDRDRTHTKGTERSSSNHKTTGPSDTSTVVPSHHTHTRDTERSSSRYKTTSHPNTATVVHENRSTVPNPNYSELPNTKIQYGNTPVARSYSTQWHVSSANTVSQHTPKLS